MALYKIQVSKLIFLFCLLLAACSNQNKSKMEELLEENKLLRDQVEYSIENARYKEKLITAIDAELDHIDANFLYLNTKKERGSFDREAEKIFAQLDHLKRKIENAEDRLKKESSKNISQANENKLLLRMIKRYKSEVITKEKQITNLKKKVKTQSYTIKKQLIEINAKRKEIRKQNHEILMQYSEIQKWKKEVVKMEAEAYDRLSKELTDISNNLPEVKGWFTKKSKEENRRVRIKLYRESKAYKKKAENLWRKYYE